jgi:tetratricopeptide (TPR) repeat protein
LVACYQGDYPRAIQWLEESQGWARDWGRAIGNGLAYLAFVYYCQDELARAAAHFAESLALFRSDGDREGIAYATYGVGLVALRQGDLQLATEMLNESLALCRAWGDGRYLSAVLDALGRLAQKQGDPTLALTYFRESWLLRQRMADRQGLAESYERLARLALPSALAVRLYRMGHRLRLAIGAPLPPVERGEYESRLAELRQRLGDAAFAAAWSEGDTLSPEQIRSLTLLEGVTG